MAITRSKTAANRAKSNLFHILPLEVVNLILDCMTPEDLSGFSCASKHALELANAQLGKGLPLYMRDGDPSISVTGLYIRHTRLLRHYQAEMQVCDCHVPALEDDDVDL